MLRAMPPKRPNCDNRKVVGKARRTPLGVKIVQLALVIALAANPTPATAPMTSTPTNRGDVSGGQAFFDAEDGDKKQNASEDADDTKMQ